MAKKRKTVTLERDGFRTEWFRGEPGCIDVNVYQGDKLVLEWRYGNAPGIGTSILGQAGFWLGQVILQVKHELEKASKSPSPKTHG